MGVFYRPTIGRLSKKLPAWVGCLPGRVDRETPESLLVASVLTGPPEIPSLRPLPTGRPSSSWDRFLSPHSPPSGPADHPRLSAPPSSAHRCAVSSPPPVPRPQAPALHSGTHVSVSSTNSPGPWALLPMPPRPLHQKHPWGPANPSPPISSQTQCHLSPYLLAFQGRPHHPPIGGQKSQSPFGQSVSSLPVFQPSCP